MNITLLKESIIQQIQLNKTVSEKLQAICNYLKQEIEYYDWVGFYFKNGDKQELKLAEFAGEPTEHIIIPFGKGICGQVAISNENFIVPNVEDQDNYISCGFKVKSEIVIPIFVNGENIGQIDIDSHAIDPFTKNDEMLLEFVCEKVSEFLQ
ncbi:MAG: GAF domain-containing protein [Lutibacter sp.]|uniref:GAF domain-containing protein n=1 Tax=Lutibacter sp. TaxID=1925666 RepID=UPI0017F713A4|nr:GAF domain-containing protein [Lutibacter sp.]MBT8316836.1 GAF domain-containing protein [Lutibacter sp.]NNJ57696.1 GAF domain-containing protein [Lutibacter sp.]